MILQRGIECFARLLDVLFVRIEQYYPPRRIELASAFGLFDTITGSDYSIVPQASSGGGPISIMKSVAPGYSRCARSISSLLGLNRGGACRIGCLSLSFLSNFSIQGLIVI